jgi:hypothetical protein
MRSAFETPYEYLDYAGAYAPTTVNFPSLIGFWSGRQAAGSLFRDSVGGSDITIAASGVTTKSGNGLILPAAMHNITGNALAAPGASGVAKSALLIFVGDFSTGSLILGSATDNGSISTGKIGTFGKVTSDTGIGSAKFFSAAPTIQTGAKAVLISSVAGVFTTAYEIQSDTAAQSQVGANLDLTAATASGGMASMTQGLIIGTVAQTIYGMAWHLFDSTPSIDLIKSYVAWANNHWRNAPIPSVYPGLKGIR